MTKFLAPSLAVVWKRSQFDAFLPHYLHGNTNNSKPLKKMAFERVFDRGIFWLKQVEKKRFDRDDVAFILRKNQEVLAKCIKKYAFLNENAMLG